MTEVLPRQTGGLHKLREETITRIYSAFKLVKAESGKIFFFFYSCLYDVCP